MTEKGGRCPGSCPHRPRRPHTASMNIAALIHPLEVILRAPAHLRLHMRTQYTRPSARPSVREALRGSTRPFGPTHHDWLRVRHPGQPAQRACRRMHHLQRKRRRDCSRRRWYSFLSKQTYLFFFGRPGPRLTGAAAAAAPLFLAALGGRPGPRLAGAAAFAGFGALAVFGAAAVAGLRPRPP